MPHRINDQPMRHRIEKRLDVTVHDPVELPAPRPGDLQRVMRATPRPVRIRVIVKDRLNDLLQLGRDHRLSDPVRHHRGHPQRADPAALLRDLHQLDRRREITPRRQPVPQLVQVVVAVLVEPGQRLLIHPRGAAIGAHLAIRVPHGPLGNTKRLRLAHKLLPPPTTTGSWLANKQQPGNPPLSLHPHYQASPLHRDVRPCAPQPVLNPSQIRCLRRSLSTTALLHTPCWHGYHVSFGTTGSHVSHNSPGRAHATFMPDTTWPENRHPPGSSQGSRTTPVSMPSSVFRHVISGSLASVFS